MRKTIVVLTLIVVAAALLYLANYSRFTRGNIFGAPPYGEARQDTPDIGPFSWLSDWQRPEGPAKVALQVGHWKNDELPDELQKLRNSNGSAGGGKAEWEVNLAIAQATAKILQENGISVDILPATIPPHYWADVFIAIHADGSNDPGKSGYKIASPWRDFTGNAWELVDILNSSYEGATGLSFDDNISRNMRGYYAFSWWRYQHAIHPMTTAAIIETGFLTSPADLRLLVNSPEIPAQGIAEGIINYLETRT